MTSRDRSKTERARAGADPLRFESTASTDREDATRDGIASRSSRAGAFVRSFRRANASVDAVDEGTEGAGTRRARHGGGGGGTRECDGATERGGANATREIDEGRAGETCAGVGRASRGGGARGAGDIDEALGVGERERAFGIGQIPRG